MNTQIAIISLLIFNNVYTQDIIVKRNGEEIKSKVLDVGVTEIKYKKYDIIYEHFGIRLSGENRLLEKILI